MQQGNRSRFVVRLMIALALLTLAPATFAGAVQDFQNTRPGSSQALAIERGRSVMLKFNGMRRVAVAYPDVADVSVMSADELLVRGLGADPEKPYTMLYVWDRDGLHNFAVTVVGPLRAEKIAEQLRGSLSPNLSVQVVSESLVVVEGRVTDQAARQNLMALLEAASTDDVNVVGMVFTAEDVPVSRADQAARAITDILGPNVTVSAWGEDVLVIEGELADQQQLSRARMAISAVGDNLRIVDMLTVEGDVLAGQAPVEQIQHLLGDQFVVSPLRGNLIAIEGVVETEAEIDRINRLLEAYEDVEAINLVQVVPPKPDLATAEMALRGALEDTDVTVTRVGDEALMLEGAVPDEIAMEHLDRVLALFEARVPIISLVNIVEPDRRRVMVGVKVLEVNRGDEEALGVNWGQWRGTRFLNAEFVSQPFLFGQVPGVDGWPHLYRFATEIRALIDEQRARILSEPNLLVNEEEEAEILIGGEIPVPVAQPGVAGAASVTIEWRPFGVRLNIRPTISPDSRTVKLEVAPEVSSLDFASGVTVGGLSIPALRTRRAETTVSVADGGVLAIGGLLQSEESKSVSKIPLLGDLPIIGRFFRQDTTRETQTELIILVMPQILGDDGIPLHPIPVPEGMDEEQVLQFGVPLEDHAESDD